jgi:hypothetical protein
MFGRYFYNKNIRNIIVLFGTVFNDITVKRTTTGGEVIKQFKVPIAYGPAEKYLTILEQGQLNRDAKKSTLTLPRMSFEIATMTYDATRKLQTKKRMREAKPLGTIDSIKVTNGGSGYTSVPTVVIQSPTGSVAPTVTAVLGTESNADKVVSVTVAAPGGSGYKIRPNVSFTGGGGSGATATANLDANTTTVVTGYNPVPYNFDIDLSIMVKNSDDGAQILEQILPYFTPEYHVTLNEMSTLGVKRDIPIVLTAMSSEDSYEGDFISRRALIHTLSFTVQAYLYGPSQDQGIIREVDANVAANFNDRIDSNIDVKPDPLDADPDDDFGFTTTTTVFE